MCFQPERSLRLKIILKMAVYLALWQSLDIQLTMHDRAYSLWHGSKIYHYLFYLAINIAVL
ncbi:hypothetical protein [Desmonostoc muscorum]|uniref:hypothetical protein n=1 Tax=Desmonostoc muscorum TaxID=1179 RepID=UPI001F2530AA|nr:hypothetical protein [Desmonostoc muscorum]